MCMARLQAMGQAKPGQSHGLDMAQGSALDVGKPKLWLCMIMLSVTDSSTCKKSVKAGYTIKEPLMNVFQRGEYIMDEELQGLVASKIQYHILTKQFQQGHDRVWISRDAKLTMAWCFRSQASDSVRTRAIKWVMDLIQFHLVEAVPKFSLCYPGAKLLDANILKPNTGYLTVERHKGTLGKQSGVISPVHSDVKPISEGEKDRGIDLAPSKGEN
ncbi:uncharacterized protein EDB91DRAFT_1079020 [Suillus paluster]|uniref:uncharacterized protein n=1 Tax=Suillus paluster TaxID=48578 RepID=UPI001B878E84|nr:uncharacterized protein EDB91DRAFT_1079020 [Suillus paluster]KAG1748885.1 hypothetical protein EDB91DRAFT_1079020 [Suillus paluster]